MIFGSYFLTFLIIFLIPIIITIELFKTKNIKSFKWIKKNILYVKWKKKAKTKE